MKTTQLSSLRRAALIANAVLLAASLSRADSDLNNPVDPYAPSPNAGVTPGHRGAGNFTARRPGTLPKYEPQPHSFTGVSKDTP